MAKRVRDYKAEEARRNALARERGFTSRAQQRNRIETGKFPALQPKRVRSVKTKRAQSRYLSHAPIVDDDNVVPKWGVKGVTLPVISKDQACRDWSTLYARSEMAEYRPERAKTLRVTEKEYRDAYFNAWASGDYYATRYHGGSDSLRYWFVELNDYYQAEEYDDRYGNATH